MNTIIIAVTMTLFALLIDATPRRNELELKLEHKIQPLHWFLGLGIEIIYLGFVLGGFVS